MADPQRMNPSPLEEEGIPDTSGGLEDKGLSDIEDEYLTPPGDRPVGSVDYGTTVAEQRHHEPLDARLSREEPEAANTPDNEVYGGGGEQAGRLVEDDEGARADDVKENVAYDRGADTGGFTAEEAAMHISDEI